MVDLWRFNIRKNLECLRNGAGPASVAIVSGSEADRLYWQTHAASVAPDVYGAGDVPIVSVCEGKPKGNLLGTFKAWSETRRSGETRPSNGVGLMSMVFGQGKRLSPFTQALGNRKAAFPTPLKSQAAGAYLSTADVSSLYCAYIVEYLRAGGFRGLVVKWGDEVILPGVRWEPADYSSVDAVRFVSRTEMTELLAREKEWIQVDERTGLVTFQYARQDLASLQRRLSGRACINLGSFAISHDFLEVGSEVLKEDIANPERWVDWDPYAWIALLSKDEAAWQVERQLDARIRQLEARYPGFYPRMAQLRAALQARTGRPLRVAALDFGEVFWADHGLHVALRKVLQSLADDSGRGCVARELFGIPELRDDRGNFVVSGELPRSGDVRNSVIMDSVIRDRALIRGGVIIGSRAGTVEMPHGGASLFCAAGKLTFTGPNGIAFRSAGSQIVVPEGGRHTTLLLPESLEHMLSNESVADYSGDAYSRPILGNRLSFEQAAECMAAWDPLALEKRWEEIRAAG